MTDLDVIDEQERTILRLRSDNSSLRASYTAERSRRLDAERKLREARATIRQLRAG